jgi:hypothetical protein
MKISFFFFFFLAVFRGCAVFGRWPLLFFSRGCLLLTVWFSDHDPRGLPPQLQRASVSLSLATGAAALFFCGVAKVSCLYFFVSVVSENPNKRKSSLSNNDGAEPGVEQ